MAKDDNVTLTREQFQELISAVKGPTTVQLDEDSMNEEELMAKHLRRQGVHRDPDPRHLKREWRQPCMNESNGSRFVARIVESRKHAAGLVVDLLDYQYPEDIESRYRGAKEHLIKDARGRYPKPFLDWKRDTFYMADMKMYVSGGMYDGNAKFLPVAGERVAHVFRDTPEPAAT